MSKTYRAGLIGCGRMGATIDDEVRDRPHSDLFLPYSHAAALAAILAFAPVFFANLVFTYSFRDTRTADMAFASNLLGAMLGGAIAYVALITGYHAPLLVVGGPYGLAFVRSRRWRFLPDRAL